MNSPEQVAPDAELKRLLHPLLRRVAALKPETCLTGEQVAALVETLEAEFSYRGPTVQAIGNEIRRGVAEGWLCNRGPQDARFSRLAKPSDETFDLSVDVVSMTNKAIEHTHPLGEVTIGFPAETSSNADFDLSFDGRGCGWVFMPPGSRHVPTVRGGRMNLIYFLPQGSVQWHLPEES